MTGLRREPGRTVTNKVISILRTFDTANGQLSLSEVANRVGLPSSTALRLLRELTDAGVLERTANGNYRVGVGLWQTGELSIRPRRLREAAAPVMVDVSARLNAGTELVLYQGQQAIVVDVLLGPRFDKFGATAGWPVIARPLPLHATAAGKLLLAASPRDAMTRLFNEGLHRFTDRTIVSLPAMLSELDNIVQRGFASNLEEVQPGLSAVAGYIRSPDGSPIASLGIGLRSPAFHADRILASLQRALPTIEARIKALGSF